MKTPEVISRGRMVYVLYPEKVVVGTGNQWISYNQYANFNRQGITQFKNAIKNSKENEYDSPVDQMSLAYRCGIRGSGASRPKELSE